MEGVARGRRSRSAGVRETMIEEAQEAQKAQKAQKAQYLSHEQQSCRNAWRGRTFCHHKHGGYERCNSTCRSMSRTSRHGPSVHRSPKNTKCLYGSVRGSAQTSQPTIQGKERTCLEPAYPYPHHTPDRYCPSADEGYTSRRPTRAVTHRSIRKVTGERAGVETE